MFSLLLDYGSATQLAKENKNLGWTPFFRGGSEDYCDTGFCASNSTPAKDINIPQHKLETHLRHGVYGQPMYH